jgi:outer membrane receptor protein involved in Fe transport
MSLPISLRGQSAEISGYVKDPQMAAVPNASVELRNEDTGAVSRTVTSAEGIYILGALNPGTYIATVQADGFRTLTRDSLVLEVGQRARMDVTLSLGAVTENINVEAGDPVLDTDPGVSTVVSQRQIDELPINGRRVDSFVLLTPGVIPDAPNGNLGFRGIASQNAFLTDGVDTTNQFWSENGGRTRVPTPISADAVQEFRVLTSGYSAEYGRAAGGIVNTVTRSGGNTVHGTAYWFFRNQDFSARDRYATINPPESRHQTGASIGGPISKERLFYFFNAEVVRHNFPGLNRIINPAFTDSAGNFNAACPSTLSIDRCNAARGYIMRGSNVLVPRRADSELYFGRLDWNASRSHQVSVDFDLLHFISPNGIQTPQILTNNYLTAADANSTARTGYARLGWTYTPSGTSVNELRLGWFKDRQYDDPNPSLLPPQTGPLTVTIAGTNVGAAPDYPRLFPSELRFQITDTWRRTLGKHLFEAGFDFANTRDYVWSLKNQYGSYSYSTFAAFAADFTGNSNGLRSYQSFTQVFGNPVVDTTTRDYSFFVQDQWRVSPSLTLNTGVRYEFAQLPQPQQSNPDYRQTGRIRSAPNNWAPRVSAAWSPNNKTVVRSGFGLFYARVHGNLLQTVFQNNGKYQPAILVTPATAGAPIFPNRVPALTGLPSGSVSLTFASPQLRPPYTMQSDLTIERQLGHDMTASAGYLWSRGVQFISVRDLNAGPLGPPVTYRINNAQGTQVGSYTTPTYLLANRVDPRYQQLLQVENGGQAWYNAMVLQFEKRFSKGFAAYAEYTWSHAIDTGNQGNVQNAALYAVRTTFNGDYAGDKGTSQLDVRHRFVVNSSWTLPVFTKSQSALARWLVNGWQLSQITTLQSAPPATTTVRVVGSPFAGAAFPTTLNGLGGSTRVPFLPYSNLKIDQIYRVDARLSRELQFSEKVRGIFNFEAFNVFNRVSNTSVLTEAYSATAGVLTPTPGVGQGNASQGFPDGTNARRAQISLRVVF